MLISIEHIHTIKMKTSGLLFRVVNRLPKGFICLPDSESSFNYRLKSKFDLYVKIEKKC